MEGFIVWFRGRPSSGELRARGQRVEVLDGDETGVSDPYTGPLEPEVVLKTDRGSAAKSARRLITRREALGFVRLHEVGSGPTR